MNTKGKYPIIYKNNVILMDHEVLATTAASTTEPCAGMVEAGSTAWKVLGS